MNQKPLISICMITYNHESYIAEAIEGVLLQKTRFPFELVIGEDGSTDNTRRICEQYQEENPEKIRLLPSKENLGMTENFVRTFLSCRGKYIAICEGDDYWTEAYKLDRQVRFLESNDSYSICTHNTSAYFQNTAKLVDRTREDVDYELKDFVLRNVTGWQSCSLLFENSTQMREIVEGEIFRRSACGDWLLSFVALMRGKMRFLGASMGVYRIHDGGVFSSKSWLEQFQIHVSAALAIDALSQHQFQNVIINHNVRQLFIEAFDEKGDLTISTKILMGEYLKLEYKNWRKNITSVFVKFHPLRTFYLRHISRLLFTHTEID